jgi:hypothetical protein
MTTYREPWADAANKVVGAVYKSLATRPSQADMERAQMENELLGLEMQNLQSQIGARNYAINQARQQSALADKFATAFDAVPEVGVERPLGPAQMGPNPAMTQADRSIAIADILEQYAPRLSKDRFAAIRSALGAANALRFEDPIQRQLAVDEKAASYDAMIPGDRSYTLTPGDVRFDADNQQVASAPGQTSYTGTIYYGPEGDTTLGFRTNRGEFLDANRQPIDMNQFTSFSNATQPQGSIEDISPGNKFKLEDQLAAVEDIIYFNNRLRETASQATIGGTGSIEQLLAGASAQSQAFLNMAFDFAKMNSIDMSQEEAAIMQSLGGLAVPDAADQAARVNWLATQLAYRLAKAADPGGKISDKDLLAQEKDLITERLTADINQLHAVLDEVDEAMGFKRGQITRRLGREVQPLDFTGSNAGGGGPASEEDIDALIEMYAD